MAEHPIFSGVMGQNEEGKEIVAPDNALTDGLAQLKFSPDHNTPLGQYYLSNNIVQSTIIIRYWMLT